MNASKQAKEERKRAKARVKQAVLDASSSFERLQLNRSASLRQTDVLLSSCGEQIGVLLENASTVADHDQALQMSEQLYGWVRENYALEDPARRLPMLSHSLNNCGAVHWRLLQQSGLVHAIPDSDKVARLLIIDEYYRAAVDLCREGNPTTELLTTQLCHLLDLHCTSPLFETNSTQLWDELRALLQAQSDHDKISKYETKLAMMRRMCEEEHASVLGIPRVKAARLVARRDLNGQEGEVVSFEPSTARYLVRLDSGTELKLRRVSFDRINTHTSRDDSVPTVNVMADRMEMLLKESKVRGQQLQDELEIGGVLLWDSAGLGEEHATNSLVLLSKALSHADVLGPTLLDLLSASDLTSIGNGIGSAPQNSEPVWLIQMILPSPYPIFASNDELYLVLVIRERMASPNPWRVITQRVSIAATDLSQPSDRNSTLLKQSFAGEPQPEDNWCINVVGTKSSQWQVSHRVFVPGENTLHVAEHFVPGAARLLRMVCATIDKYILKDGSQVIEGSADDTALAALRRLQLGPGDVGRLCCVDADPCCAGCGKLKGLVNVSTFKYCGRCRIPYCSEQCQRSHWPSHKRECRASSDH